MHAFAEVFWVLAKWVVSGKETFTVLINDATKSTWTFRAAEGSLCRKQVKIKARCPERITELRTSTDELKRNRDIFQNTSRHESLEKTEVMKALMLV